MASMKFIRQILAGKKKLLKRERVIFCPKVERFRKLTVEKLVDLGMEEIPELELYLPLDSDKPKVDRGYLLNVSAFLITLGHEHPEASLHRRAQKGHHHREQNFEERSQL